MDRSVKSKPINYTLNQRIIVISDIHGNLSLLQKLLKKIHYQPVDDLLIFLGDLVEKGPLNLDTLRYIMKLCEQKNTYALMGNCDFVCKNIVHHYNLDFLKKILMERKASLLHEMAATIGLSINDSSDMNYVCDQLLRVYQKELCWVDQLPQVLYCDDYIFVHAGIKNEATFGEDFREVLTNPHFLLHGGSYHRYVIVGHMPVSEYSKGIACFHPIINEKKHIISIDGGNIIKTAGQLNAFLIQNDQFSYESCDDLPTAVALCDVQTATKDPLYITWRESEVIILEKGIHRDLCQHLSTKRKLWIDHSFLHEENGKWMADDYTTYRMPLKRGETVSIIAKYEKFAFIKKEGILGWCLLEHLRL